MDLFDTLPSICDLSDQDYHSLSIEHFFPYRDLDTEPVQSELVNKIEPLFEPILTKHNNLHYILSKPPIKCNIDPIHQPFHVTSKQVRWIRSIVYYNQTWYGVVDLGFMFTTNTTNLSRDVRNHIRLDDYQLFKSTSPNTMMYVNARGLRQFVAYCIKKQKLSISLAQWKHLLTQLN